MRFHQSNLISINVFCNSTHHLATGRPASIAVVGTAATTPRNRSISMMSNLSPNRSDIYGQPVIVYPYLQVKD